MNDKTKGPAARPLYRITYTHVTKDGHIRAGSLAVEAADVEEAQKVADRRLASFGLAHHRITGAKEY